MQETLDKLSDEELMLIYQSGEAAAFELLYQRHSGQVLGYLKKRTNPENARELLQESFLKLHRARARYSAEYPFLPWLFTLTRNVLFDFLRRKETKVAQDSLPEAEARPVSPEPEAAEAPDFGEVLQTLPAAQRRALELRYLEDWSFEQIASELATTQPNVRQLVSRGLRRLRSRWVRRPS